MYEKEAAEIKKYAKQMLTTAAPSLRKGAPRPTPSEREEYNVMRQKMAKMVQTLARTIATTGSDVNAEFDRLGLTTVLRQL